MLRTEIDLELKRVDELVAEIDTIVPAASGYQGVKLRADLAGLLVVAIAATYENCVKEVLFSYTGRQHATFESYARRRYGKINSKISVQDLKGYCELLDPSLKTKFQAKLASRKKAIVERTGVNIETMYGQLLEWRHEFAHTGARNTTLEEAARAHLFAKRIIYIFAEALH
jgi:hypothetical protein